MEVQGKIRECPHCEGTGTCKCDHCRACLGLEPSEYYSSKDKVACFACGGKGAFWIGPPPLPGDLHHHNHTHEATTITGTEQLAEAVRSLTDKFDEIVREQSLILSQVVRVLESFEDSALTRRVGQPDKRETEV
jgi:hypothetical protein